MLNIDIIICIGYCMYDTSIWSMVMSRCLMVSQAYKTTIGLPIECSSIDGWWTGGGPGATLRRALFIYSVCRLPTSPSTGQDLLHLATSTETKYANEAPGWACFGETEKLNTILLWTFRFFHPAIITLWILLGSLTALKCSMNTRRN